MNVKIKQNEKLIAVWNCKNKLEMRESVLTCKWLHNITAVIYGRKTYSMSDIYAGR